jgi:hypothetical protein
VRHPEFRTAVEEYICEMEVQMNRDLSYDIDSLVFSAKLPRLNMDKESSTEEEGSQLRAKKGSTRSEPNILLKGRTVQDTLELGS